MAQRILSLCIAALMLLSFNLSAYAQGSPTVVSIQPAEIDLGVDQTMEIAISIENASELYGMEIQLTFDPEFIEIEDAEAGSESSQVSLGTFLEPGLILTNHVDNAAGKMKFVMTQRDPSLPKSGNGVLLVVKLHGKAVGMSQLEITQALLADQNGNAIETRVQHGTVTVFPQAIEGLNQTELPKADTSGAILLATPTKDAEVISDALVETPQISSPQNTPVSPQSASSTAKNSPKTDILFVRYGWIPVGLLIITLVLFLMNRKTKA